MQEYVAVVYAYIKVQLAESLRSKGVNVILLEAQDTLGGRTKKCIIDVDGKKVPYDIGGEYLGIDQNALFQYVTNVYKTQLDSLLIDTYEMTNFMDGKQINPLGLWLFKFIINIYYSCRSI